MSRSPRWVEYVRTSVALCAVVTVGALAIGCGSTANNGDTSAEVPKLTVWYSNFRDDTMKDVISRLSTDTYEATAKSLPFTSYEARTVDAIAADEAPDVWLIPNDWIPDHLNKLVTIPDNFWDDTATGGPTTTTAHIKEQYMPFLANDLIGGDNRTVGFPGPAETLILYKNRTVFSDSYNDWLAAHPDATEAELFNVQRLLTQDIVTWDDFVQAVRLITHKDGTTITQAGAALGASSNITNANDILQLMIYQQGGSVVDSVKRISLFNNYEKKADGQTYYPGKDAFTFFLTFSNPNNPNYSWNSTLSNSRQAFLDGKVGMIIDYPEFGQQILQNQTSIEYDTSPAPQVYKDKDNVNFARYYVAAVTKASKNQRLAAELARSLAVDNGSSLVEGWPGSSDPKLTSNVDDPSSKQLKTARTVYKRHHILFDQAFSEMIDDVAVRGLTIDNAINRGAERVTNILQSE